MSELDYVEPCIRVNGVWVQTSQKNRDRESGDPLYSESKEDFMQWMSVIGTDDEELKKMRERQIRENQLRFKKVDDSVTVLQQSDDFRCVLCKKNKPVKLFSPCKHPAFCYECMEFDKNGVAGYKEKSSGKKSPYYRCLLCDGLNGCNSVLISANGAEKKGSSGSGSESEESSDEDDRPRKKSKKNPKSGAKPKKKNNKKNRFIDDEADSDGDGSEESEDEPPKRAKSKTAKGKGKKHAPAVVLNERGEQVVQIPSGSESEPEEPPKKTKKARKSVIVEESESDEQSEGDKETEGNDDVEMETEQQEEGGPDPSEDPDHEMSKLDEVPDFEDGGGDDGQ